MPHRTLDAEPRRRRASSPGPRERRRSEEEGTISGAEDAELQHTFLRSQYQRILGQSGLPSHRPENLPDGDRHPFLDYDLVAAKRMR